MKYINLISSIVGAVSAAVVRECRLNPKGTAPEPIPNTLEGFKHYEPYQVLSKHSRKIPGYEAVMYNAECAIASPKYMMYVVLDTYDPEACANFCTSHSGCDACKSKPTTTYHISPLKNFIQSTSTSSASPQSSLVSAAPTHKPLP